MNALTGQVIALCNKTPVTPPYIFLQSDYTPKIGYQEDERHNAWIH